jgi:hypothetical protein
MVSLLKNVRNSAEVEDFLDSKDLDWEPLGQTGNNVGIIRSGSDPAQALTERITNAIDAVIERDLTEEHIDVDDSPPANPREAVKEIYNLTGDDYLDIPDHDLREMGQKVYVTLKESGNGDRPTVELRDKGMGQPPEEFHSTFVGLNEDNKIKKPYLIGKYGQGGSNTFAFAKYTIIMSRSHKGGELGWTIVRFNERLTEEENYSDGVYEYCVLEGGEIPFVAEEEVEDDWTGSLVRLIEYDAADFSTILTAPQNSLYWAVNKTMFGAVFPFMIGDQRTETYDSLDGGTTRRIVGNRYRLNKNASGLVEDERKFEVDVDKLGSV